MQQNQINSTHGTLQAFNEFQKSTPINSLTKFDIVDNLHGPNDPYRPALGHDDLVSRITQWAMDVIEKGIWPKSQCLVGVLTDVTGVVQAEVQRLTKLKHNNAPTYNGHNGVLDVARRHANANQSNLVIQASPNSASNDGSGTNSINAQIIAQLGLGNTGHGGGGDQDGDGGGDEFGDVGNDNSGYNSDGEGGVTKNEFMLVNPRNITNTNFIGRNLNSNPYMLFSNSLRRLILAHGSDGELLLQILDKVETMGTNKYINELLQEVVKVYPKVAEFDLAMKSALLNWISGVANSTVKYGVCNGLDAWRELYNTYVPLAEVLQQILIQELFTLKPVSETEIDALFNEIERITDLYVKAGPVDDLSEKWINAAALKNIPDKIPTAWALELRKVISVAECKTP